MNKKRLFPETALDQAMRFAREKMEALSDRSESAGSLLNAAKLGASWLRWWIEQHDCECEGKHYCGITERRLELKFIEDAIKKAENTPAQPPGA